MLLTNYRISLNSNVNVPISIVKGGHYEDDIRT